MVKKNKFQRVGIRTALSAAMLLTATSASAVSVDGSLSDLTLAIANETLPGNTVNATDANNDAGGSGFDITNGYAWYDVPNDIFYVGMSFVGQVGTSGGTEGDAFSFCGSEGTVNDPNPDGIAGVFDSCENYGFSIQINSGTNVTTGYTRLDIAGDANADSGEGTELSPLVTGTLGLTLGDFDWAVYETADGVEFSVTGLAAALGDFSVQDPTDVTVGFYSGSGSNPAAEDILEVQMQVVPVPAAAWLFCSGLLGLMGFSTRAHRAASQNNGRG